MSGSLRYKNPIICNHLASQYVVSVMTPRSRARVEKLRLTVPELDAAIIRWSTHFAEVHKKLPETQPQPDTWRRIEARIGQSPTINTSTHSFWNSLGFWRLTGLSTSFASLVLALMLFVFPPQAEKTLPLVSSTPSYMAVMSPFAAATNKHNDIRFVVNAYQKTATKPSQLFIQWSASQPRANPSSMHLWAKDKDTGELLYIGKEPSGATPWALQKATWLAIANSSDLLFTNNHDQPSAQNTLFTGPCIQLGSWKQHSI